MPPEKKEQSLSLLLYLFASFLQSAFWWLMSIYVSKKFGAEALGLFSYALAVCAPLHVLSSLQLKNYFLTSHEVDLEGRIKWLRMIFPICLFSAALLLVLKFEPWIVPLLLPLLLIRWGELWSELAQARWQKFSGLQKVNLSLLLRYSLFFLLLLAAWMTGLALKLALFLLAGGGLLLALLDHKFSGLKKVSLIREGSLKVFKVTLALSVSSLLTSFLVNFPRYQLKQFWSVEEVGSFSILFFYYAIPSMAVNFACQGTIGQLAKLKHGPRLLVRIIFSGMAASAIYYFVLNTSGEGLTRALYGRSPAWEGQLSLLIALALFMGSLSSVLHYLLMAKKVYHVQLRTNALGAAATILLGLVLIPRMGIQGAFLSFLSGLLIQSLMYAYFYLQVKE